MSGPGKADSSQGTHRADELLARAAIAAGLLDWLIERTR
jgi:hypothetical protein